tara:strand:- start:571 stop:1266 length:696 start_codon:yes stop_codon:yes gene_type:complete
MLSIIIPTYNVVEYIEECLDSIESQNALRNIEYEVILGVDNCEKTLAKIQEIRHKYTNLRVIYMDSNKGLFITLNTLISISKYKYLLKFDADDIMNPNLVETIWKHREDYDIIRFGYTLYYSENDKSTPSTRCANGVYLVNSAVYDEFGGYEPWICSADTEFLQRFTSTDKKQLELNNNKLFLYRQHNQSLCNHPSTGLGSTKRREYQRQYLGKPVTNIFVLPVTNTFKEL